MKLNRVFNRNFIMRWGLRILILSIMTYGLFSAIDTEAVDYTMIYLSPFVLGAVTCGWICPAGFIQDLVFIEKFSVKIPDWLHRKLRWFRYIFAILMVLGIFVMLGNIQHGIGNLTMLQFAGAYIPIGFALVSMFINRFFCRYFCPFGGIYGLKSLVRPITINRDSNTCISCKTCDMVCPMQIKMSNIKSSCSPNCINCFKCIERCPKKSLQIGIRNYKVDMEEIKNNIL